MRIEVPAAFDFAWMRRFLTLRRVSSIEQWSDHTYVRSVWVDGDAGGGGGGNGSGIGRTVVLRIRHEPGSAAAGTRLAAIEIERAVRLAAPARRHARTLDAAGRPEPPTAAGWLDVRSEPALPRRALQALVTRMFDLDADVEAFAALVRRDRLMGPLVRRQPHLRLPRIVDPFEGLVRAMLGQQVTVRAASTMTDRVVRQFGAPLVGPHDDLFAFPRPETIAAAGAERLRTIGLTRAKAASIERLAIALASGRLDCARLATLGSDEADAALLALPGIGPWTASYVRMRVLGDRDAFPAADLGVIKALDALGVPRDRHVAVAERWRPWRAYATLHLWESL